MALLRKGSPGLYVNFETPPVKIQDERGRFTKAVSQLHRQNQTIAFAMQAQVAQTIDRSIMRKSVSTGRLVQVTRDPRNATYTRDFAGVGNPDFLDKSIAKYWRTIEEGSAKTWTKRSFLSLELQGLWGTNTGGWRSGPSGDWVALGGKEGPIDAPSRRGRFRQEMYHPMRYGRGSSLPVFHPTRQIRPMQAYAVARKPEWTGRAIENGRQFIEMVIGRGIRPSGLPG